MFSWIFLKQNITAKNIFEKNIFTKNNFQKKIHQKYFQKNTFAKYFSKKKGGGETPLLPAGPRLILSDSEISAHQPSIKLFM